MNTSFSRRDWIKNTATVVTGLGIAPSLLAHDHPYVRPGAPILLNANENPYGPSLATRKAMTEALNRSNRYPDDAINALKNELATFWQVGSENILMGAGSSELLGISFMLASTVPGKIISAEPSYKVWTSQAESFGLTINRIPLTSDKTLDLGAMLSAVDQDSRLVYICNPNNPTGTFVEDASLRNFVTACAKKCTVLIDEAYTEFQGLPSLKDMAVSNPNIIVAKTFSKIYGLAGARIGYVIAHPDTIIKMGNRQPWPDVSVSTATAAAASAALKDQAFVNDCREKTTAAREMCYATFKELNIEYIPSVTSFILFNIEKIGPSFSDNMKAKNIFVQYRDHFGGKWCRVTMGTLDEMQVFCAALKSIVR